MKKKTPPKPPIKQAEYAKRMVEKGYQSVRLWIPKSKVATIKAMAEVMRSEAG